eukprot:TRINITY_DN7368_c0_g1_i4.p1 TRINITY_DN7368_c0_g1~~TRINITY_DN7368_c0_g1_i4.p1  ORF type:complete len:233 (+),score=42.15 TRINITY_DN7368_c0_g1_i4:640-1338(+)
MKREREPDTVIYTGNTGPYTIVITKSPPETCTSRKYINGWTLYRSEIRPTLKSQNPQLKPKEVTDLLSSHWKELSPEAKKEYQKRAQESEEIVTVKSLKAPQVPSFRNAFIYFSMEHRGLIARENPTATSATICTLLSAQWKALSADEKAKYFEKQHADQKRYHQEKATARMLVEDEWSEGIPLTINLSKKSEDPKKKQKRQATKRAALPEITETPKDESVDTTEIKDANAE